MHLRPVILAVVMLCPAVCHASDTPSDVSGRSGEIFTEPQTRALAEAGARGDVRRLERLVKQGADVNAAGRFGLTPAWWAIRNRNKAGFEWLLAHGAQPNPKVESITIMEMAGAYEDSGFLEIALRYKPDVNVVRPGSGNSPLNAAITYHRTHNLELLLKAGADPNKEEGGSPLISAAGTNRYDLAYLMLQAGADTSKIIADGPNGGQNELAYTIAHGYMNTEGDAYVWRERVIRFLKGKGIVATRPLKEGVRKAPLPPDLVDAPQP